MKKHFYILALLLTLPFVFLIIFLFTTDTQEVQSLINTFATIATIVWITTLLAGYFALEYYYRKDKEYSHQQNRLINSNLKIEHLQEEIQRYNKKLNNVIHGSNLGYWDWEIESDHYYVNDRWLEILNLTRKNITNHFKDFTNRLHPIDKSHIMPQINQAIKNDKSFNVEFRMLNNMGDYVWIEATGAVIERDGNGEALRLSGTHQDISKRKGLESIRNKNREYLNILFDNNPNIIIVTNANEILSTNNQFFKYFPEFSSISEFKKHYRCICDLFESVNDEDFIHPSKNHQWYEEAMKNNAKVLIRYKDQAFYFKVIANAIRFDGEPLYIVTFTDITRLQNLQQKLERISIIDELTGIYNRRHFNRVIKQEVERVKKIGTTLSFVMMDLDNFKRYNDNYGHDKGDEILTKVANTFEASLKRKQDYVFRLGGEEFGVLFSNLDYSYSIEYANSVRKNIANLALEHKYNEPYGIVTVSVGLCFVDFGSDDVSITEIYHYADQALYESKANGRNVVSSWRLH